MDKIITPLITLIFVASGSAKLLGLEFELEAFDRWGYPLWFMYFTGVVEVIGGLVIWVKRLRLITSVGLNCVMIGAVATHLLNAEWPMLGVATVILILTLINTRRFKNDIKPV
ncbi:MAG: DoxX family protein [Marinobacterium sp.]